MKKALIVAALLACALAVFADDGTVLPAGVFRARVIPAYAWLPGSYDNNGKYTAYSDSTSPTSTATIPGVGFALEYGVNDWVTAGLQWAPGIIFGSDLPSGTSTSYNMNGLADLFAGVMVQIVGPKAPVTSNVIRFDLTPGVKIPLGGVDFSKQTGSTITVADPDKQTLGLGGRAYLDYVFSDSFFLDLYSQFIYYPNTVSLKDSSYYGYLVYAGTGQDPKVDYGYDLRIEIDPHYSTQLTDGLTLSANCAFRYDGTPDLTYDGKTTFVYGPVSLSSPHTSLFSANPSVSLFLTKTFMPLEFTLDYGQPIAGTNTSATYSLDLQVKAYFKL